MEEQKQQPTTFEEFESRLAQDDWAKKVLLGGVLMYAGAVLFGFFRNLQLFEPTFAGVSYAQIGYFAVMLLAGNAFILPLFIHKRASGNQFVAAIVFYVTEMAVYVLNAVLEPRVAEVAVKEIPFWSWYYWNVAFAAPVLIMVGWGILFLLDPESKMSRALIEARGELIRAFAGKAKSAARHPDVTDDVTERAREFVNVMGNKLLPGERPLPSVQTNGNLQHAVPPAQPSSKNS